MKIQEIRYHNHPIMGDLSLSFKNENGEPYDTVVFAGENGTGKTTILQTISSICNKLDQNCDIECRIEDSDKTKLRELGFTNEIRDDTILLVPSAQNSAVMDVKYKLTVGQERKETVWPDLQNREANLVAAYISTIVVKFKTNDQEPTFQEIHSTTELTVDKPSTAERLLFANRLNASELLVNINYQDAIELQEKVRSEVEVSKSDAENRIKRFRTAFDKFFDNRLSFLRVENFKIWFQKGGSKFGIGQLSSGEKTIVQYGAFFLKDQNADETFFALIDEPEQSLHPHWEDKILQYYKDILTKDQQQLSQAFITTHSEYIIKDAHEAKDLIIVLKRSASGQIEATPSLKLSLFPSSPTYNEIKYSAFGLVTPDFHSELFDYLHTFYVEQGDLADGKISTFDTFLSNDSNCPAASNITPNLRSDQTLPVYIRNFIDHPSGRDNQGQSNRRKYRDNELDSSVKYLMDKIKALPNG